MERIEMDARLFNEIVKILNDLPAKITRNVLNLIEQDVKIIEEKKVEKAEEN